MQNNYPLHIENQFEKVYVKAINRIAGFVIPKIKDQYTIEQGKQFDADNYQGLEFELNEELEVKLISSPFLESEITKVAILLDRWALAQTNTAIKRLTKITPKKARQFIPVEIDKLNPIVEDYIRQYTSFNMDLVAELGHEFIPEVSQLAQKAFIYGESTSGLADKLLQFTEEKRNKAKFWAQDQTGDAFSAFTKLRQTQAGFPGYIWRTVGDNHVRPLHAFFEGRYFTWSKGAPGLSKPGAKHPGQDYRCRCFSEPAMGEMAIAA